MLNSPQLPLTLPPRPTRPQPLPPYEIRHLALVLHCRMSDADFRKRLNGVDPLFRRLPILIIHRLHRRNSQCRSMPQYQHSRPTLIPRRHLLRHTLSQVSARTIHPLDGALTEATLIASPTLHFTLPLCIPHMGSVISTVGPLSCTPKPPILHRFPITMSYALNVTDLLLIISAVFATWRMVTLLFTRQTRRRARSQSMLHAISSTHRPTCQPMQPTSLCRRLPSSTITHGVGSPIAFRRVSITLAIDTPTTPIIT